MLIWFLIIFNLLLNFTTIMFGTFKNETFKNNILYVLLILLSISLWGATIQLI